MEQILLNGINLDKLLDKIGELIDKKLDGSNPKLKEINHFLSRKETAGVLKITLPTLHDWTKIGLLQSYKIGITYAHAVRQVKI